MNRGIAKRTCFPDKRAKRMFLALLACAVRRGELIVEAFAILDTHYHLMVRSTETPLSYAMMRIQNSYARYFNRRFQRDGPLFRGRFRSIPVDSLQYARTLVRYIDWNAVSAGLSRTPSDYPFGSAWHYDHRFDGPVWLDREHVTAWVAPGEPSLQLHPGQYGRWTTASRSEEVKAIVEARLQRRPEGPDDLDALMRRPPPRVARWMRRKAALADGLAPWMPIASPRAIEEALQTEQARRREAPSMTAGRTQIDAWPVLRAGLLHTGAGMRILDIARRTGHAPSTISRRATLHLMALADNEGYAETAGRALARALELTHGPW